MKPPKGLKPFSNNAWGYVFADFYNKIQMIQHVNKIFPKIYSDFSNAETKNMLDKNKKELTKDEKIQLGKISELILSLKDGKKIKKMDKNDKITENVGNLIFEISNAFVLPKKTMKFIQEMSVVYLVTIFEDFLERILYSIFEKFPKNITSDKEITYKELVSITNLSDWDGLKETIIGNEINRIIQKEGIKGWSKKLTNLKIDLTVDKKWNEFTECFARRNIIIHNGGNVNKYYSSITHIKRGDEVNLDMAYVDNAVKLFEKFGIKLMNLHTTKILKNN